MTHDSRVFHYAHSIAHMDDGRVVDVTRPDGAWEWEGPTEQPPQFQETYA